MLQNSWILLFKSLIFLLLRIIYSQRLKVNVAGSLPNN